MALAAPAASAAVRPPVVAVQRATLDVARRVVAFDVTCRAATPARCRGVAGASTGLSALATSRRVALVPGGRARIALRLLPNGMHRFAQSGLERLGELTFRDTAGRRSTVSVVFSVRVSCRTGATVARAGPARLFRIVSVGVYGCERPAARPWLLASELDGVEVDRVEHVRIAGDVVAYAEYGGFKCSGGSVNVFDLRAGRLLRSRPTTNAIGPLASGCTSTARALRLVVRPSGAVAWTEAPGDAGNVTVRALDHAGDRLLDSGPAIDPQSLRLGAGTVTWTDAGQPRSAPLR
jgi:hypothetical protein